MDQSQKSVFTEKKLMFNKRVCNDKQLFFWTASSVSDTTDPELRRDVTHSACNAQGFCKIARKWLHRSDIKPDLHKLWLFLEARKKQKAWHGTNRGDGLHCELISSSLWPQFKCGMWHRTEQCPGTQVLKVQLHRAKNNNKFPLTPKTSASVSCAKETSLWIDSNSYALQREREGETERKIFETESFCGPYPRVADSETPKSSWHRPALLHENSYTLFPLSYFL